jgi:hypothetical protein
MGLISSASPCSLFQKIKNNNHRTLKMKLDPNPLFRKVITPWYDRNMVCVFLLVFMGVMIIFSIVGWTVSRRIADYHAHTWVPVTLLLLSLFIVVSVMARLIHRRINPQLRPSGQDD